jgi:hypothetical protein
MIQSKKPPETGAFLLACALHLPLTAELIVKAMAASSL